MPDVTIEDGLRSAFQAESEHQSLTITTAELERRLVVRRRSRSGRRIQLLAAAIAIVAFAGIAALTNGWLRLPAVGTSASPAPSAAPSTPDPSAPATASQPPAAFTPPEMRVSVATLGQGGETLLLSTRCYSFELADGQTGTIRCPGDPSEVACCQTLEVPWSADLTFTIPDGWAIERSEIGSKGNIWADDRAAPTRTITGWSSLGDEVITFEGTYSKDGDRFTATFAVPIHGPTVEPRVGPPSAACGKPDLTSKTPPVVNLVARRTDRGSAPPLWPGEFGTTAWSDTFSESAGDPMPETAVEVARGAELELRIAGDVCARAWDIGYGPRGTGEWLSIDQVGSLVSHHRMRPTDQAALANRFELAPLPPGDWYIEAVFRYADGDASVGWHVLVK